MAGEVITSGLTNHQSSITGNNWNENLHHYFAINANHPFFYVIGSACSGIVRIYYRTSDTGSWILDTTTTLPSSSGVSGAGADSSGVHAFRWKCHVQRSASWSVSHAHFYGASAARRNTAQGRLVYVLGAWNARYSLIESTINQTSNLSLARGVSIVNASQVVLV
jgi:hypothetical protein